MSKKFASLLKIFTTKGNLENLPSNIFLCLRVSFIQFLTWNLFCKASIANCWDALLMLYGGLILLNKWIISAEAKASPTLSDANPHAFERVCITTRLGYLSSFGKRDCCVEKSIYASS